jgi:acyl-CoA hydrolase
MPLPISAHDAVQAIQSGDRIWIHGMAAAPRALINALVQRADSLRDVEIVQLHTEGPAPYADPEYQGIFRVNALFVGANVRKAVDEGKAACNC